MIKIFKKHALTAVTVSRKFYDRNYEISIYDQVSNLIMEATDQDSKDSFRISSSANGGIKVGILSLTSRFSGKIAENMALQAGANVVFSNTLNQLKPKSTEFVDALIVVGGIDHPNLSKVRESIVRAKVEDYNFHNLIYAGNSYIAEEFQSNYSNAIVSPNPLSDDLSRGEDHLTEIVRSMYLDDLIGKVNVIDLQDLSEVPIWPTPAVVNMACENITKGKSCFTFPSPTVFFDIGGATTDVHFGIEVLDKDNFARLETYASFNRFVFTELGVVSSRQSTIDRLSSHERLYEFLSLFHKVETTGAYADVIEGVVDETILFAACMFLALDEMTQTNPNTVPTLVPSKIGSIVITGGASQKIDPHRASEITKMFLPAEFSSGIPIFSDADYEIWTEGAMMVPRRFDAVNQGVNKVEG